jgi:WSC domain.
MQRLVATTALIPVALAQATYYGCYVDPPARALTGALMVDYENMTISVCEEFCTTGANSFPIWGIEYGGEWWVLFHWLNLAHFNTCTNAFTATVVRR